MKQVIVGTYEIGYEKVELVLREGKGGEFYLLPGDINCPRIKVGADQEEFWMLVDVLFHEVSEFAAARLGCRYEPEDQVGRDIHAYTFILTHIQFSNMNAMTAGFICRAWNDLTKAWEEWNKEEMKQTV